MAAFTVNYGFETRALLKIVCERLVARWLGVLTRAFQLILHICASCCQADRFLDLAEFGLIVR